MGIFLPGGDGPAEKTNKKESTMKYYTAKTEYNGGYVGLHFDPDYGEILAVYTLKACLQAGSSGRLPSPPEKRLRIRL